MKLGLSAFMTVLALLVAPVASAADHDFAKWLVELRQEAKGTRHFGSNSGCGAWQCGANQARD